MKDLSTLSESRTRDFLRTRFNPIRGLEPVTLSSMLDAFDVGDIRRTALLWDKIADRDGRLTTVIPKRYGATARRDYSIVTLEDSPRAEAHQRELEYFYRNLRALHATKLDEEKGIKGLIRQMMTAVGNRYAAHEIIWKPSRQGLTADFKFVPLYFFEARTGRLRYLESETDYDGRELEPGGWMTTTGPGLMEASSVAYMFKAMPLKDLLSYCEKYGLPGVVAKTNAQPGSEEWNALADGVRDFMNDFAAVMNGEVAFVAPPGGTQNPMMDLVDYCDKVMTQIWRGGNLGTEAGGGDAVGSERQGDEGQIIEADDVDMIQETLNRKVDRWVIRYTLGDEEPLARFELQTPEHFDAQQERETDKFFIEHGLPLKLDDLYRRHSRSRPEDGDEVTTSEMVVGGVGTRSGVAVEGERREDRGERSGKAPATASDPASADGEVLANEGADLSGLVTEAVSRSLAVLPEMFVGMEDVISDLIDAAERDSLTDDELSDSAAEMLLRLPDLGRATDVKKLAKIFEGALGSAAISGAIARNGAERAETPSRVSPPSTTP